MRFALASLGRVSSRRGWVESSPGGRAPVSLVSARRAGKRVDDGRSPRGGSRGRPARGRPRASHARAAAARPIGPAEDDVRWPRTTRPRDDGFVDGRSRGEGDDTHENLRGRTSTGGERRVGEREGVSMQCGGRGARRCARGRRRVRKHENRCQRSVGALHTRGCYGPAVLKRQTEHRTLPLRTRASAVGLGAGPCAPASRSRSRRSSVSRLRATGP